MLKHFIQISHLWGKNSEADHLFENKEESRFNFLQIKGKLNSCSNEQDFTPVKSLPLALDILSSNVPTKLSNKPC
jgi:hypothetical protein